MSEAMIVSLNRMETSLPHKENFKKETVKSFLVFSPVFLSVIFFYHVK